MQRIAIRTVALFLFGCALTLSARSASASTLSRQLGQTLPELKFEGVTLNDAVDFLRDVSGANISVNWKALAAEGVTPDSALTLKLRNVSLRKGLDLILAEAGAGDKLGWTTDQNVIEISTRELIDSKMYTRVYPIEDLLLLVPDFVGPRISLTENGGTGSGNSGSGSGTTSSSSSESIVETPPPEEKPKSRTERADELISLIRDVVRPEIWVENGGTAAIKYWNGNLIVTAPRSVLEAIGGSFE